MSDANNVRATGEYRQLRYRVLDLFCKAGGAAMGYARAGFEVVGVDIEPQPNYPFEFIQADALTFEIDALDWDLVHASPPCQGYSTQTADPSKHRRLIEPVRQRLVEANVRYVIENVEGARKHLIDPVRL